MQAVRGKNNIAVLLHECCMNRNIKGSMMFQLTRLAVFLKCRHRWNETAHHCCRGKKKKKKERQLLRQAIVWTALWETVSSFLFSAKSVLFLSGIAPGNMFFYIMYEASELCMPPKMPYICDLQAWINQRFCQESQGENKNGTWATNEHLCWECLCELNSFLITCCSTTINY